MEKFDSSNIDQFELSKFSQDLWEKQKEKSIRIIMESIKLSLMPIKKNLGRIYCYEDIVRCARQATFMGDDTMLCVSTALERLQLTEEFPR